jgi:Ca-activated chloride channel homolog
VPVFTVAIAPQPSRELQEIAEVSGGQAFAAPTSAQLEAVYRDLGTRLTYVEEKRELTSYFMGGAALFLLLGAAASITWFLRLP